jgi:hypothetical protein
LHRRACAEKQSQKRYHEELHGASFLRTSPDMDICRFR